MVDIQGAYGDDGVEVVQLNQKGRHLVISGVLSHFVNNRMYGCVRVVGRENE